MNASRREFLKGAAASGALMSGLALSRRKPAHPRVEIPREGIASDPLRPQYHLLPARNWMNDPNGPIYWKGSYHMFFQYNPNAAVWGDMHWAHAISPDMIHWKHLPLALAPTPGSYDSEGCFSGSAVDDGGVATFLYTGVKSVPAAQATLRDAKHNFMEVQCLATSRDDVLQKWDKLPAPVLLPPNDPNLTGFRDPCLWQMGKTWYMGIGSGARGKGGRVLLYRSEDLRHWQYVRPLATGKWNGKQTNDPVDAGEMWECPDFFPLGKKHVLLYSTERKVYWQSGELDPETLIFNTEKRGLLDHGAFYAPKTQLDAKGRRILWGWIPETRTEAEYSAAGWAGCMSLPRALTLAGDGTLQIAVIPEMARLRDLEMAVTASGTGNKARVEALQKIGLPTATAEIAMEFQAKPVHFRILDGTQEILRVAFDPAKAGGELRLGDRVAPVLPASAGQHRLRMFLDGSVFECFLDGGLALTSRVYLAPKTPLRIEMSKTELAAVESLCVWPLRAISPDRLTT